VRAERDGYQSAYLVLRRVSNDWKNAQHKWTAATTRFAIVFGDRFSFE
jgi:transposase-like protein